MIAITTVTPLDILDFNFILYCPPSSNDSYGGTVITRTSEFSFVFGFLKYTPTVKPFEEGNIFFREDISSFQWTCPLEYQENQLNKEINVNDILINWEQFKNLLIPKDDG